MESQLCHNILFSARTLGLKITWKYIYIGLYGYDELNKQISYEELFEYFDIIMVDDTTDIDIIIKLLGVKNNLFELDSIIEELSMKEQTDFKFELNKWRICLLKKILDADFDYVQGLLEMLEFWLPIKDEFDCPHIFPEQTGDKNSINNYFSEKMYQRLLCINRMWADDEIKKILQKEMD